jgi:hypothetical protein
MKNLLTALLLPLALLLNLYLNKLAFGANELNIILTLVICIFTFSYIYTELTTIKKQ